MAKFFFGILVLMTICLSKVSLSPPADKQRNSLVSLYIFNSTEYLSRNGSWEHGNTSDSNLNFSIPSALPVKKSSYPKNGKFFDYLLSIIVLLLLVFSMVIALFKAYSYNCSSTKGQ